MAALMIGFSIVFVIICIVNAVCVSVLIRNTCKNRFHWLLLSLSVSDLICGLALGTRVVSGQYKLTVTCIISEFAMYGSVLLSLVETSLICLERLNATYYLPKWWIQKATSKTSVLLCILACMVIGVSLGVFVVIQTDAKHSTTCNITAYSLSVFADIPLIAACILITISYCIVIKRMKDRYRKVKPNNVLNVKQENHEHSSMTESNDLSKTGSKKKSLKINSGVMMLESISGSVHRNDISDTRASDDDKNQSMVSYGSAPGNSSTVLENGNNGTKRMTTRSSQSKSLQKEKRFRQNMTTLGVVIAITVISILPKCGISILMHISPNLISSSKIAYLKGFLLINPIIDPFVYVFRIKEFRDKINPCKFCR